MTRKYLSITLFIILLLSCISFVAIMMGTSFGVSSYVFMNDVGISKAGAVDDKGDMSLVYSNIDAEMAEMRNILSDNNFLANKGLRNIIAILRFVRSKIAVANIRTSSKTPLGLYNECRLARGGLCADIALISMGFLRSAGYKTRIINLWSNLMLEYGLLHTSLEVYEPSTKKWILIDPYFNVYFSYRKSLLSAKDMGDLICDLSDMSGITVNHIASNSTAAQWLPRYFLLFNNIAYYDTLKLGPGSWRDNFSCVLINIGHESKLIFYQTCNSDLYRIVRSIAIFHFIVKHLLPIIIVASFISLIIMWYMGMRRPKPVETCEGLSSQDGLLK